jgi:hypothetical protein
MQKVFGREFGVFVCAPVVDLNGAFEDAFEDECIAKPSKPLRMSVWPLASHTRTPLGTGILGATRPL